ncbi:MAG: succinyl-diaminopimelate desuccinylase [Alphaproteobacteria bacterium]|nr:succinyl-diaminopimelate desuccinylase [Alphaproteobacteria bacterium]
MSLDPVTLTQNLIQRPSVTPNDGGCLDLVAEHLEEMRFTCHRLPFGEVSNLYARLGTAEPNFCFAGHTDVVPIGDLSKWSVDPFGGVIKDGYVYGRGAVDMKGAIACFIAAVSEVLSKGPFKGSISLLLTSDEEGPAHDGTIKVIEWLKSKGEKLSACLVGEPTNPKELGQMVKVGRRGSLNAKITAIGRSGHVAYPHFAVNPIPPLLDYLQSLLEKPLDEGMEDFDPSNLEITSVDVGNPTTNVIPDTAIAQLNVRFNPAYTGQSLTAHLETVLEKVKSKHKTKWILDTKISGEAFLTHHPVLRQLVGNAVHEITGKIPEFSTSGGTSDARFLKNICPVMEFGLINAEAHQIDEKVRVEDLVMLTNIYERILEKTAGVCF